MTQLLRHQHYNLGGVDNRNTSICTCHAGVLRRMQDPALHIDAGVQGVRGNYVKMGLSLWIAPYSVLYYR